MGCNRKVGRREDLLVVSRGASGWVLVPTPPEILRPSRLPTFPFASPPEAVASPFLESVLRDQDGDLHEVGHEDDDQKDVDESIDGAAERADSFQATELAKSRDKAEFQHQENEADAEQDLGEHGTFRSGLRGWRGARCRLFYWGW